MRTLPGYDIELVPFSGCFIWMGPTDKNGYGKTHGKLAHRIAWEKTYGPIPKGLYVLHHCDIPCCVNTKHMFLGTQQLNMDDMWEKQRRNKDLNDASIRFIRDSLESTYATAKRFEISQSLVSLIKNRKRYRNIE